MYALEDESPGRGGPSGVLHFVASPAAQYYCLITGESALERLARFGRVSEATTMLYCEVRWLIAEFE